MVYLKKTYYKGNPAAVDKKKDSSTEEEKVEAYEMDQVQIVNSQLFEMQSS